RVRIFAFETDLPDGEIRVTPRADRDGADLFKAEFGYVEATVRSLDEFTAWLGAVDDVTHVALAPDEGVALGGRRFPSARTPGLTVDDVAALYQAHTGLKVLRQDRGALLESPGFSLDPYWDV